MDMLTLFQVARRRWYVVLLGLALTGVVTALVYSSVKPTYSAQASVVLLSPSDSNNPYLEFSSGLGIVGKSLTLVTTSDAGVAAIEARGGSGNYSVTQSDGAIIDVAAKAPTADQATGTVNAVLAELDYELSRRQVAVKAPETERIELVPLTTATPRQRSSVAARVQLPPSAVGHRRHPCSRLRGRRVGQITRQGSRGGCVSGGVRCAARPAAATARAARGASSVHFVRASDDRP